jgi:hypothetical protein
MATPQKESNLRKAIAAANEQWDSGNKGWFDFVADDVVVYSIGTSEPFRGRDAWERHFGPRLAGSKRKTETIAQNIQFVEGAAVVAQTLQIVQDGIVANVRQSVIWSESEKAKHGWLIKHLHSALIGNPSAVDQPRDGGAIRVLNERIATMAAQVGVAQ